MTNNPFFPIFNMYSYMRSVLPREHTTSLRRPAGVERVRRSVRGAAGLRHRRGAATGGRRTEQLAFSTVVRAQALRPVRKSVLPVFGTRATFRVRLTPRHLSCSASKDATGLRGRLRCVRARSRATDSARVRLKTITERSAGSLGLSAARPCPRSVGNLV